MYWQLRKAAVSIAPQLPWGLLFFSADQNLKVWPCLPWEETDEYIRSGHRSSDDFQEGSFRTITIDAEKGIKAVTVDLRARTLWKCRVIFLLLFVYQFSK